MNGAWPNGVWLMLAMACGEVAVPQPPPDDPVDAEEGWQVVREAMLRPRHCYRGWAEYCVTDPDTVDGIVQSMLDRHFDGVMPQRKRDLDELTRDAVTAYGRYMRNEGREAVEARVRAWYDDPAVEVVAGKGVSVRIGMPPGTLSVVGDAARPDAPMALSSPLVHDGELRSRELARLLAHHGEAHPDASAVRLFLTIPKAGAAVRKMDVRWYRDLDRVVIYDPDEPERAWATEPLGGDLAPYLAGEASLHTSDLRTCRVERPNGRPLCDDPGGPR